MRPDRPPPQSLDPGGGVAVHDDGRRPSCHRARERRRTGRASRGSDRRRRRTPPCRRRDRFQSAASWRIEPPAPGERVRAERVPRPRVPLSGRDGATGRSSAQAARSTPSWRLPLGGHAPRAAGRPGDRPQPRTSLGAPHEPAPYVPNDPQYAPTTRGPPRGPRESAHSQATACSDPVLPRSEGRDVRGFVGGLPAPCVAARVPATRVRPIATPHVLAVTCD